MKEPFDQLGTQPLEETLEPNWVQTRFKIEFDSNKDEWPIDGHRSINAGAIKALVSPSLRNGLHMSLIHAAKQYAWATVHQYQNSLAHFQKTIFPQGQISAWRISDVRKYRALLIKEYGHEDCLRHIRSLLTNWHNGRWDGVSSELVASLKKMKLKGAEAGRAVRVMDPDKGPLTPNELHHLVQDLNDAAADGKLSLEGFSLAYLHIFTGRRPIQSAYLKCCDVAIRQSDPEPGNPNGSPLYLLVIPRAKQRGHGFRETRRAVQLTHINFEVFRRQAESVQERFLALLKQSGWNLNGEAMLQLLGNLPLYPKWHSVKDTLQGALELQERGQHRVALESIVRESEGSAWHYEPSVFAQKISAICESVGTLSRDGGPLSVNALRLRHTKGTDLARDGLDGRLIGWILDHSTSRSSQIYIDSLPEHAAEINKAFSGSLTMQRFASAFRGTLVDKEVNAIGGSEPDKSRLTYRGAPTATCGHLKQCGLDGGIPRACYLCHHFQPWIDGPHEQFLEEMERERTDSLIALGPESPVAKRADKIINAVHRVIQLCFDRRKEIDAEDGSGS